MHPSPELTREIGVGLLYLEVVDGRRVSVRCDGDDGEVVAGGGGEGVAWAVASVFSFLGDVSSPLAGWVPLLSSAFGVGFSLLEVAFLYHLLSLDQ